MCAIVSPPPLSVNLPEMHVCAIIHAREIRYIVEFGLLVVVRSSRDQLISIVENSSGLKFGRTLSSAHVFEDRYPVPIFVRLFV